MATNSSLCLVSLVVEVNLPPCAPGLKLQTLQFMCRKQLKPFKRDSLVAFQTTGGVPHVYICLNQSLDRVFVISESGPAAEQYAVKFRNSLLEKLRHPSQLNTFGPFLALADPSAPYRVHNYVARVRLIPESELSNSEGLSTFLDLPALKEELAISVWPSTVKVLFDPLEYPALVWIENGSRKHRPTNSVDLLLGPKHEPVDEQMKTIIFPSGVIVVHGTDHAEAMIEGCQRKLPFLQRFIRTAYLV